MATNVEGDDRRGSLPQLAVNQWENDRTWYHKPTPRVEVLWLMVFTHVYNMLDSTPPGCWYFPCEYWLAVELLVGGGWTPKHIIGPITYPIFLTRGHHKGRVSVPSWDYFLEKKNLVKKIRTTKPNYTLCVLNVDFSYSPMISQYGKPDIRPPVWNGQLNNSISGKPLGPV